MSLEVSTAHLAVASLNQTVGDWDGNERRILEVIAAARGAGARLLLLPEMCLPGYSLGDRLLRAGTAERSWRRLGRVAEASEGIAVAVGLPVLFEGVLFNAMALVADGRIVGVVAKENLASGDVEYENRYFQTWPHGRIAELPVSGGGTVPIGTQMFVLPGLGTVAFEICEDAWGGIRPGSSYALAGAEILLNPSASWFVVGKHRVRRRLVTQISYEDHCAYLYASLLGCDATRLVFDGSLFIAMNGRVVAEGRRFLFGRDWEMVDAVVDLNDVRQVRMEQGSWRDQHDRAQTGDLGERPAIVRVDGDFSTESAPAPPEPYWLPPPQQHPDPSLAHLEREALGGRAITEADLSHLELELGLALALRDYRRKTGVPSFCLALSGGRDSAMVALLVARMLRYSHPELSPEELRAEVGRQLTCAYLATDNSGEATRHAAHTLADALGARFLDGRIQAALDAVQDTVETMVDTELSWDRAEHDLPLQNVQARLRGALIWTVANLDRSLLLVTSNKSEAAVGYTTMDGDTSGGLAPISDVPKSLVILYLDWARRFHGLEALDAVTALQPTAELRPPGSDQTDEADLMPFAVLDQLMYAFVQLGLDPLPMMKRLWPNVAAYYPDGPAAFGADVEKFVRMLCFAQWKRERFAIGFRVTAFDLDPKTGFRFPPVQAPFDEEIAELRAFLADLEAGRVALDG